MPFINQRSGLCTLRKSGARPARCLPSSPLLSPPLPSSPLLSPLSHPLLPSSPPFPFSSPLSSPLLPALPSFVHLLPFFSLPPPHPPSYPSSPFIPQLVSQVCVVCYSFFLIQPSPSFSFLQFPSLSTVCSSSPLPSLVATRQWPGCSMRVALSIGVRV